MNRQNVFHVYRQIAYMPKQVWLIAEIAVTAIKYIAYIKSLLSLLYSFLYHVCW